MAHEEKISANADIKEIVNKPKNYLSKSMFERINGVDIENLKTSELLRQVKLLPILFKISVVCSIFIAAFGLLFVLSSEDSELAIYSLFFLGFSLVCVLLAFIFPKRLKNVKSTLDTRELTEDIKKNAEKKLQETKKYAIIGIVLILIVSVIVTFSLINNSVEFADNQCHFCERKFTDIENKKSIARTNMCENCYDNYKDLEWVLDE
ncbi:MAG: hypothetical protein IKL10_00230 [Clostridia bacterium]|nr:hypothetical protein [Clostridia bacterium]